MRLMSELRPLFLYSADQKVYVPVNTKDRRRGSAILFLSPDMKTTMHLTMLPYLNNPALYQSFYIDRNIAAFIDKKAIEDFDEQDAKAVSEAMIHQSNGTKFKMDRVSTMDEKYIRDVYNKNTVKHYSNFLGIKEVPDSLKVVVHPSVSDLRKNPAKYITQNCDKNFYSYTDGDTIHILSRMVYDPFSMRGNYEHYLLSELLYALIVNFNKSIPYITGMGIALAFSGIFDYMEKEKNNSIPDGKEMNFATGVVKKVIEKDKIDVIREYIKTGNISVFAKFAVRNVLSSVKRSIFESTLSYMDRQRLLPSDFGIPNKRAYPLHDEDHVKAAIRMFNHCDSSEEKELAENIIKKMKRYGMTNVNVSDDNRFSKYYRQSNIIKESSYISFESKDFIDKPIYNGGEIYIWNGHKIEANEGECGEYFWNRDGEPVAYYMTVTYPDDYKVYITRLKCIDGMKDAYGSLICRAMDRQNADYALVPVDSDEYKILLKCGFKEYETTSDGYAKLSVKDTVTTSFENDVDANWNQVQSVCNHLSPQELGKITFTDKYENSKFVIKRYIGRIGNDDVNKGVTFIPAGFLDVYQYPSNPKIAQVVIAVDERYRGLGVATSMVQAFRDERNELAKLFGFDTIYWTAHPDNEASKYLATHVMSLSDTGKIDRYGRQVFIGRIGVAKPTLDRLIDKDPGDNTAYVSDEAIVTNEAAFIFEANNPDYTSRLKQYLYSERIKTDKQVLLMYKEAKSYNPSITKTYLKLEMYKNANLFVDLSYYHALFLKKNMMRLDNAVNFYFDFLNKLINNAEVNALYHNRTIFIPVDSKVWQIPTDADITDYRTTINPISIICRLIRTNSGALRNAWGNKNFVFVSDNGYFTVNFATFDMKDLPRFKKNIEKLNKGGVITDEEEYTDTIGDDKMAYPYNVSPVLKSDTTKAMTIKMIDTLDRNAGIKIDDISALEDREETGIEGKHLSMATGPIKINADRKNNEVVVITLDADGPAGFEKLSDTVLSNLNGKINTYCMPK